MRCVPRGSPKNIQARGRTRGDLWPDRETHVVARLKNGISEEQPKNVFISQIRLWSRFIAYRNNKSFNDQKKKKKEKINLIWNPAFNSRQDLI